ncbi:4-hydroxy-2-oxoglutarate aldolase [Tindallia magadiensis]|uniref:4-hydroxy-2-oxoglutarate aldolase n=1 Tax=Tindallia magadiensis TaxID=69895 RepID=A0A1I3FVX6_9FIRM|nr:dihydrodipicolinate synthase family protein [Tindallia magadiensis]SFI15390.1 4-hydroxy-2-oxoglutarate aldolase [Tindallia magadiensis]
MFRGIYTPIVTPFDEKEEIDYQKLLVNLSKLADTPLEGLVVLGSNGEFPYLTEREKLDISTFVLKEKAEKQKVIVGASHESVFQMKRFIDKIQPFEPSALLVLPPHYYKSSMKEEALYQFFVDIADYSPMPIMLYNMPGNTGINMPASLVVKLSCHPNILGIKDTAGNIVQLSQIVGEAEKDFSVFAGSASYLLPALTMGAKGATLALSNVLAEKCCEIYRLFNEGETVKALEQQQKIIRINTLVTAGIGVPALKYAMDLKGYQGGMPRKPMQLLTEDEKTRVRTALAEAEA